jgi:hypothetical protein
MHPRLSLSLLCVLACGSDTGDTPDSGGTIETVSTTDATPTGGVPEMCEMYRGEQLGSAVTLTVTNGTDVPVWIGTAGCIGAPRFEVYDASGTDDTDRFDVAHPCAYYDCEDYLELNDCTSPDSDCNCADAISNYLLPGKSLTAEWPGGHSELLDFTQDCALGVYCVSQCFRSVKAPEGAYTLSIQAYETCTVNCDCEPNSDGWCHVPGDATQYVGAPLVARVDFNYPEDSALELTIVRP